MKNKDHLPVYGIGPLCVYSMVLLLIAALVIRYYGYLDSGDIDTMRMPFKAAGVILIAAGVYMWIQAVMIDRIGDGIIENHLVTEGVYAWVRNPIYSAVAILLTGISFMFCNLWLLVLPPVFWLDITVLMKMTEEKWLLALYGDEYRAYCRKVNRCIPFPPSARS